jgi:WD40 repeat protein
MKVLLFAANPRGAAPLDLSREFREIDEETRLSAARDSMQLILVPGARPVDLLRKLNEIQPQVVHFSSHGGPDEILLESGDEEDELFVARGTGSLLAQDRDMKKFGQAETEVGGAGRGRPQPLRSSALVDVLRSCDEGNLRLVVLNACDTRRQAVVLTEVVDCVVSMNRAITDRAAIKFAASFYGALASGRSVRKAYDQGVARLRAESIPEADTPELHSRAGVDAADVVLVGSAPRIAALPATDVPFLVPFPRNPDFVGRDGDLARLHATLAGPGPVGIRPAGLSGMGGIGKTQLAVEYVHRYQCAYPDGIFWVDAAGPLDEGFARLATNPRLGWAAGDQPRDDQVRAAFAELGRRSRALLVLDNLAEPAALAMPVLTACVPEHLGSRVLFTTRRHDLGRFAVVEVSVLGEDAALRLLLRHSSRAAAVDPSHPDHEDARAVARMLGRLPLALELAGAYLGKFSDDVSLADYRKGLKADGALATLDADVAELTDADLRRVHDLAVAATIGEQWEALQDESAQTLLRVASLFPESAALPMERLGLLAGLGDVARAGRLSPLRRAVRRLDDACLVERMERDHLRLHPLIREFAASQTPPGHDVDFRHACADRAASGLEDFATFEALEARRGVDGLQEDLVSVLGLSPGTASDTGARLWTLLRLIQREAHNLRVVNHVSRPTVLAQQVRNRAFLLGISPLRASAERRLDGAGQPHFQLRWMASRESPGLVRTLTGHEDWVTSVAVSPDGRLALSSSNDRTLKLWDLATGQARLTLTGHAGSVLAAEILPDGRQALSASEDGTLRLWDLTTGLPGPVFTDRAGPVYSLSVAADGRHALSGSRDGTLKLWSFSSNEPVLTLGGHDDFICAVALTPDGGKAVSGFSDGHLEFWDVRADRLRHTVIGHEGPVFALALTRDGHHVLSGSIDGHVRRWDLERGQLLYDFPAHRDEVYKAGAPVYALTTTSDGRQVLSGCGDGTVRLWGLDAKPDGCFVGHERGVTSVAVTPDGGYALSGSTDRTLRLWDLGVRRPFRTSTGHKKGVAVVALTPDGRQALSGAVDSTMIVWDLSTSEPHIAPTHHQDWVRALAVTPDGGSAISGCDDGVLRLWDLRSGRLLASLTGHEAAVTAVAVTPDGRHALSGSRDRTLRLWELSTGKPLAEFGGNDSFVTALSLTPDGSQALAGFRDGALKLWDLRAGRLVRVIAPTEPSGGAAAEITADGRVIFHDRPSAGRRGVTAVAVTPDGGMAVSGAVRGRGELRLWDLSNGELRLALAAHDGEVTAVAVTPDGRHAVSASLDRTLRLCHFGEGTCRAVVLLESAPMALALSSDGRAVVAGDGVGNVHYFSISMG